MNTIRNRISIITKSITSSGRRHLATVLAGLALVVPATQAQAAYQEGYLAPMQGWRRAGASCSLTTRARMHWTRFPWLSREMNALALFNRMKKLPGGTRLFSLGVCRAAPYFSTISPHATVATASFAAPYEDQLTFGSASPHLHPTIRRPRD
ncbi:MAG: hypothetical protein WBJ03_13690 [Moraxellaceae bacterium]